MSSKEIILKVQELETKKNTALERQSLAGKEARAVQKEIEAMNSLLMKAVMSEQAGEQRQAEPMFEAPTGKKQK